MSFFSRGVRWLLVKICSLWYRQYYYYPGISSTVVFAASFPGIVRIICPQNCEIGSGSVINAGAVIHCVGGVSIGKAVHIGHGFCTYSTNHNYASDKAIPYDATDIVKPVVIQDCVWIGANVSIVPGVTVGEGAIIGMGAVITRDVSAGAIVGGNPAQVIGCRDMNDYYKLKNENKIL